MFNHSITITNNVFVTNSVVLVYNASTKKELEYKIDSLNLGENVFVGYRFIIFFNINIGNNVIVGNPYRIMCIYEEYTNKNREKLKSFQYQIFYLLIKQKTNGINRMK